MCGRATSAPSGARKSSPPECFRPARSGNVLGQPRIQREQRLAAAALLGTHAVPLVRQKAFQRHDQEGAKPALLAGGPLSDSPSQQPGKELLGQVLGVGREGRLPARVGVRGYQ